MKVEQVLELVKAVSDSELTEFKYEDDGVKLTLKKTSDKIVQVQAPAPTVPAAAPVAAQGTAPTAPVPVPAAPANDAARTIIQKNRFVLSPVCGPLTVLPPAA